MQELLTLREHLCSPPGFSGVCVPHFFFFFFLLSVLCLFLFGLILFVFVLCLVYQMMPVSLVCPFLIAPSVFSNVYLVKIYSLSLKYCLIALKRLSIYMIIYLFSLDVSTDNGSLCNSLMLFRLTCLMYVTVHMKTSKMQICLLRFIP